MKRYEAKLEDILKIFAIFMLVFVIPASTLAIDQALAVHDTGASAPTLSTYKYGVLVFLVGLGLVLARRRPG